MDDSMKRQRSIVWQTMVPLAAAWASILACHGPSPAQDSHSAPSGPSVSRASWTWRVATDGEVAGAYPLVLRVLQDGKVAEHELVPLPDGRLMLPEPISHSGVSFESIRPAGPEYGLSTTGLYEGEPLSPRVGLLVEEPATVIVECEDTNERFTAGLMRVSQLGKLEFPRSMTLSHGGAVSFRCPPGGYLLMITHPGSPPAIHWDDEVSQPTMLLHPGGEAFFEVQAVKWEEVDIPLTDWAQEKAVTDRTITLLLPWSQSTMHVDSSGRFRVRLPKNRPRERANTALSVPIDSGERNGWRPYGALTLPDEEAVLLLDPPPFCHVTWPAGFQPLQRLRSAPLSIVDWPALWRGVAVSEPTNPLRSWMQHELEGRWSDEGSPRVEAHISILDLAPTELDLAAVTTSHTRELRWNWESAEAAKGLGPAPFAVVSEWEQNGEAKVRLRTVWDSPNPEKVWLMQSSFVSKDEGNPSREWTHRAHWERRSEVGHLWVGSAALPAEPSLDPLELVVWTHRVQCQDESGRPVPFAPVRYLVDANPFNFAMADAHGILQVHLFGSPVLVLDTLKPAFAQRLRLSGPFEAEQPERFPPRPEGPVLVYTASKRWIDVELSGLELPHPVLVSLHPWVDGEEHPGPVQTMYLDSRGKTRFRAVTPGSYEVHLTNNAGFSEYHHVELSEQQEFATVKVIASESQ